ncbi:MAG: signal peptidase II [Eubacteriales bacterium]|nr:signal peptidase II [Eubacteriales bacterium]MDD3882755.1 signal peptidase II [Eubacteriales bacterium]MDD4512624.1 signal peptidase II [Eubacteriales bacterium]
MKKWIVPIAAVVFALDRLVKLWVAQALSAGQRIDLIPGVIGICYTENTGMAFGMLSGGTVVLAIVTLVILAGAVWLICRVKLSPMSCVGFALSIAGALGNLFDRVFYGYVVDMIEPLFVEFAVFNIADIALCIGLVLIGLSLFTTPSAWEKRDE